MHVSRLDQQANRSALLAVDLDVRERRDTGQLHAGGCKKPASDRNRLHRLVECACANGLNLGCALLHGPHVPNAAEIFAAFDRDGGSRSVADAQALHKAECPTKPGHGGAHVGSRALRAFLERAQPPFSLSGHIHESPNVSGRFHDAIGRTRGLNPGQLAGGNRRDPVLFPPAAPEGGNRPSPRQALIRASRWSNIRSPSTS